MNRDTILEKWEQNFRFLTISHQIQELIHLSFHHDLDVSEDLRTFLSEKLDFLIPILQVPPFSRNPDISSAEDLLENVDKGIIRDLILILWIKEQDFPDVDERLDLEDWKNQSIISAFFAHYISRSVLKDCPFDIFILAFFKEIWRLMISGTFPTLFQGISKLEEERPLDFAARQSIIGAKPEELSAWVLMKWGFPEEALLPLVIGSNGMPREKKAGEVEILSQVLVFSQVMAKFVLGDETFIKYNEVESLFQKFFQRSPSQFQSLIVEVIRSLPRLSALMGFTEIADFSIFEIMKDHMDLLNKDLLTYEDLLTEVIKASKKMRKQETTIRHLKYQIENRYIRDSITGLYNYFYLQEYLVQKMKEAERYEYPITLILFDIDDFKSFNLEFGYRTGNDFLFQLTEAICQNIRQSDFFARFGGDEFALVLPYTGLPQSKLVAQKIQNMVTDFEFTHSLTNTTHKLTISLGFASVLPDHKIQNSEKFISMVLKAVRKSQSRGGNTISQAE